MQRFIMTATVLFGLALGLFVTGPQLVSAGAGNANCDDFPNQQAAQRFFQDNGGSATNNVAGLDDNHNGIACDTFFGGGSVIVDPTATTAPIDPTATATTAPVDPTATTAPGEPTAVATDEPVDPTAAPTDEAPIDVPVDNGGTDAGVGASTGTSSGVALPNTGTGDSQSTSMTTMTLLLALFAGACLALGAFGLVRGRRG